MDGRKNEWVYGWWIDVWMMEDDGCMGVWGDGWMDG